MRSTRCGCSQTPVVGDRAVGGRHLHRGHGDALPDRDVADRRARPLVGRKDDARRLAREVDAGLAAEPEALDPLASPSRCSCSASVTTPTFDERERICETVIVCVPRGSASWMMRSATGISYGSAELRRRRDDVRLEHAADGHDLERRARLVRVGDGAVAQPVFLPARRPRVHRLRRSRARRRARGCRPCAGRGRRPIADCAPHRVCARRRTRST